MQKTLEHLVPEIVGRHKRDALTDRILSAYGPQLGEMVWHSLHIDEHVEAMSRKHADVLRELINRFSLQSAKRPIRILEVGAYTHFSVHIVASELNGIGVTNDISPVSLRVGADFARSKGIRVGDVLVASDFHDLPFSSNYFDLVFVASSVHHTFRPWLMMDELFRVVRPSGIVHLENEPVGRLFCFYQYRGNRQECLTPFEAAVNERGLTWTLSSPYPGSRQEEIFGMIENDRIPLSIFLDTFATNGVTIDIDINSVLMGDFEHSLLQLPRDQNLASAIAATLEAHFAELATKLSVRDVLMGFSVPRKETIWLLSYRAAQAIKLLSPPDTSEYQKQIASLFGAPLKASVKKIEAGFEEVEMFKRSVTQDQGVYLDVPPLTGVVLNLTDRRLPDINTALPHKLETIYPPTEWINYKEASGLVSLLNRSASASIILPDLPHGGLMLIRFYAAAKESPYIVRFSIPDRTLDAQVICQSESRLARFIVPAGAVTVTMAMIGLDQEPIEDHASIHLSIARVVPIEANQKETAT
jgi:SAM-dependent methyltransferase